MTRYYVLFIVSLMTSMQQAVAQIDIEDEMEYYYNDEYDPYDQFEKYDSIGMDQKNGTTSLIDTNSYKEELFNSGNKNTFRVLFSGTPGRAALYSLILPGAGQAYNKRYWKIPLVYAALGGVGYLLYDNARIYKEYKQIYIDNLGTPNEALAFNYYKQAKQLKEQAIFAVIGVHLFNIFDAYIDRHLIEFDIDEDISLNFGTIPNGIPAVGFTFRYNIGTEIKPATGTLHK